MDLNQRILKQFGLSPGKLPLEIPNAGRRDLARWFYEWGFKEGAEIGVFEGEYSSTLCKANPGLHLYCIDPWKMYPDFIERYTQEILDSSYETASKWLSKYNVTIMKQTSVEAAKSFNDNSLDFVYVDGNHKYDFVLEDLNTWYPKVRPGGVLSGHDYRKKVNRIYHKVVEAVNHFMAGNNVPMWFVVGSKEYIPGCVRDNYRSWFVVKP